MIKLRSLLFSDTSKDSFILLTGNLISTLLIFIITIVLTRNMNPSEFGFFITALAFSQLITDLFGLGIGSAMINYIPNTSFAEKIVILKASFVSRLVISSIVSLFVFLFSNQIAELIFHNSLMTPFIKISSIGIFLMSLLFWGYSYFQSEKQFVKAMFTQSSINALRLLLIILILTFGLFSPLNTYLSIQFVLVIIIVFIFVNTGSTFLKAKIKLEDYIKIFKFGLPVGIAFSLAAIYAQLDQILVLSLAGEREAGIYGLSFRVAAAFILASASLNSAIAPRFSSIDSNDYKSYFQKAMLASLGLIALTMLVAAISPFVFPIIFGDNFKDSIFPFQILIIGVIFFILASPMNTAILYKFKNPKFSLVLSAISLIIIWFLLNQLVPIYGGIGAAISVTITYFIQLIITTLYYLNRIK